MKNKFLFFCALITFMGYSQSSRAQIGLEPTDTTVCPGTTYTIQSSFASNAASNNTDDYFNDAPVNIGFTFQFYGDDYTQCVISANNFLTFDLSWAGQHSDYVYTNAVNSGQLDNAIMFPFQDIDFAVNGGSIWCQTFGVAPHRKFVVQFCDVPMFSCTTMLATDQVVLYEGTNIIEMYITNRPDCTGWESGTGIEGLRHNNQEDLVPGRNTPNVGWSATNDGRRFTPQQGGGYIIDTIPYNPIPVIENGDGSNIVWYAEGNPNPIGTGASITVTSDSAVHYYVATLSGVNSCVTNPNYSFSDTSWVHIGTKYDTTDVNICYGDTFNFFGRPIATSGPYDTVLTNTGGCDSFIRINLHVNPLPITKLTDTMTNQFFCKGSIGTIALAQPSATNTYVWERNGQPLTGETASSINTIIPGDYRVIVTTNMGCVDSSKLIHLSKDSISMAYDIIPKLGCSNDTVQILNHSENGVSYSWNFGDGSYPPDTTRNPEHIYQNQGIYQITLTMKDAAGCRDSLIKFVKLNHPLNADFVVSKDSVCQGSVFANVQFNNQSTGAQNYAWDFGDGSPGSSQQNPSHNFSAAGSHQVRLIVSDSIPCYDTAYHTIFVDSSVAPNIHPDKTDLCTGESINLYIDPLPSDVQNIIWNFGDGTTWTVTGDSTSHSFDQAGQYTITATAEYSICAPASDTIVINVHNMPYVNLGNDSVLCLQGAPITLTNLSANTIGVNHYKWSTGDTTASIVVTHPGRYSLTVFSNFDCATTKSITIKKDCYIDVPNAFTPNGDGENDYFFPRKFLEKGATGFSMSIYNRWGEKIFETDNINGRGWDGRFNGKAQPEGVYVYQIHVIYKNGNRDNYTGNLTLIR